MLLVPLHAGPSLVAAARHIAAPRFAAPQFASPPHLEYRRTLPPFATAVTSPASSVVVASEATSAEAAATGKSALVLGWFFATERELAYVTKMYKKNGYDEVVIKPSPVGIMTKPRGWYRTIRRRLQPKRLAKLQAQDQPIPLADLDRHFDVVHCMSGGFLQLYVLLRSGISLNFSTLLFDSTPILPQPVAFTTFLRAYMHNAGWTIPLKLIPAKVMISIVAWRWRLSILYIRAKHALLGKLGRPQGDELNTWVGTDGPAAWGFAGDFPRVSRHALGTVFEGATRCGESGAEVHFLYNPDDEFMDVGDVEMAAELATQCGLSVHRTRVGVDHIKALFSSPKTVFGLLSGEGSQATPNREMIAQLVSEGHADEA